jgi:hypothetical protein
VFLASSVVVDHFASFVGQEVWGDLLFGGLDGGGACFLLALLDLEVESEFDELFLYLLGEWLIEFNEEDLLFLIGNILKGKGFQGFLDHVVGSVVVDHFIDGVGVFGALSELFEGLGEIGEVVRDLAVFEDLGLEILTAEFYAVLLHLTEILD